MSRMSLTEKDIFKISRFIISVSGNDPFYYGWGFKLSTSLTAIALGVYTYLVIGTLMQIGKEMDVLATSVVSFTIYYQVKMVVFVFAKEQSPVGIFCIC